MIYSRLTNRTDAVWVARDNEKWGTMDKETEIRNDKINTTPNSNGTRTPRIFVVSVADERRGVRHGCWLDAALSADEMTSEIDSMVAASTQPDAGEWAIRDIEHFGPQEVNQFDYLRLLAEYGSGLQRYGAVFPPLVDYCGGIFFVATAHRFMKHNYGGSFPTLSAYAEDRLDFFYRGELDALPGYVATAIDYERVGQNLLDDDSVFTLEAEGELHVFATEIENTAHMPNVFM